MHAQLNHCLQFCDLFSAQVNRETGANYEVSWQVIHRAAYGMLQIREWVFIIGLARRPEVSTRAAGIRLTRRCRR